MRRFVLAALCLAMSGAAGPVRAVVPMPTELHAYYGPLRVCGDIFAFDVLKSEAYVSQSDGYIIHLIFSTEGHVSVGRVWTWNSETLKPFGQARGEVDLPHQRLQRYEIYAANSQPARFLYVYARGPNSDGGMIESNQFDGSERDRAILERIVFGARAREVCASVPAHLRPGPERERPEAYLLAPARRPGPLTLCTAGLAFDVGPGEAAILPWQWRDAQYFRIVAGDRRTDVAGLVEWVWRRSGEPDVQGPVARDPRFVTRSVPINSSDTARALPADPNARLVNLFRPADALPHRPSGSQPTTFTFDRSATETERQAFIQRLRTQRPGEKCSITKPS